MASKKIGRDARTGQFKSVRETATTSRHRARKTEIEPPHKPTAPPAPPKKKGK